jgi:hypothetical protein
VCDCEVLALTLPRSSPSPQPQWPFKGGSNKRKPAAFFGKDDVLAVFIAGLMGLQHALAMIGGLITPPLLIGALSGNGDTQRCE